MTLKSALYEAGNHEELLLSMTVDQAGVSGSRLKIADSSGTTLLDSPVDCGGSNAALEVMLPWLGEHGFLSQLTAAGHRLVQGGLNQTGTTTDQSGILVGDRAACARTSRFLTRPGARGPPT